MDSIAHSLDGNPKDAFGDREPLAEVHNAEGENILRVGCRVAHVSWAIEIRFYRRVNEDADHVYLHVVGKESDETSWLVPEIGTDVAIVLPGAQLSDLGQIGANFAGEDCVFPVANFTLHRICEEANRLKRDYSEWLRTDDNDRLTVVGHSLGGAAAQFIANSMPPSMNDGRLQDCPGMNAYSFGARDWK